MSYWTKIKTKVTQITDTSLTSQRLRLLNFWRFSNCLTSLGLLIITKWRLLLSCLDFKIWNYHCWTHYGFDPGTLHLDEQKFHVIHEIICYNIVYTIYYNDITHFWQLTIITNGFSGQDPPFWGWKTFSNMFDTVNINSWDGPLIVSNQWPFCLLCRLNTPHAVWESQFNQFITHMYIFHSNINLWYTDLNYYTHLK